MAPNLPLPSKTINYNILINFATFGHYFQPRDCPTLPYVQPPGIPGPLAGYKWFQLDTNPFQLDPALRISSKILAAGTKFGSL